MTTIAQVPLKHRCFTVADFHRMGEAGILGEDERLELIEGEIIEMTPIGSPISRCCARARTSTPARIRRQRTCCC
jgi:hypothetical protein